MRWNINNSAETAVVLFGKKDHRGTTEVFVNVRDHKIN